MTNCEHPLRQLRRTASGYVYECYNCSNTVNAVHITCIGCFDTAHWMILGQKNCKKRGCRELKKQKHKAALERLKRPRPDTGFEQSIHHHNGIIRQKLNPPPLILGKPISIDKVDLDKFREMLELPRRPRDDSEGDD